MVPHSRKTPRSFELRALRKESGLQRVRLRSSASTRVNVKEMDEVKKMDPRALQSLNQPRPLRVRTGSGGRPRLLYLRGGVRRVLQILEIWQVNDEWWRDPVSRRYARLALEDGRIVTVYRDLITRRWYLQNE